MWRRWRTCSRSQSSAIEPGLPHICEMGVMSLPYRAVVRVTWHTCPGSIPGTCRAQYMVVSFSPLLRTCFVLTPGQCPALREARNEAPSLGNQLSLWETTTLLGIPREPSEAAEDAGHAFLPPCGPGLILLGNGQRSTWATNCCVFSASQGPWVLGFLLFLIWHTHYNHWIMNSEYRGRWHFISRR